MKIALETGRSIALARLEHWRTYQGLLCGKPTQAQNDEKVLRVIEAARTHCAAGDPHLIRPRRRTIAGDNERGTMAGELLPATTCIALFNSTALARSDSEPYSSMVVVWFQEEFALPIEDDVLGLIRRIDWESQAVDWNW